jgi:hypothetical protein
MRYTGLGKLLLSSLPLSRFCVIDDIQPSQLMSTISPAHGTCSLTPIGARKLNERFELIF